ncbi:hypothetical protein [Stenomitos frigidus]|uniref:Uncharacterized protein n=1 Tax=Stenomitos frigidus ULC18 TaxID=2107698 RepID=A0A2T1E6L3_9CYAN|nr:hypothetical protein [Stenomitos frigidus]PSB28381.1 hypothetical protein C7B82_13685 [Stenomitos frigidus ULC18]
MSRQVLERGVLACSALALYGWSQPSVSEPIIQHDCKPTSKVASAKDSCAQSPSNRISSAAPEKLVNDQWSDRQNNPLPDKMEAVYSDLLAQAQALVGRNQVTQAVDLVGGIPKNSRHYGMSQQLQDDWSRELLRQATGEYEQARIGKALSMLNTIPPGSQLHNRVTDIQQRWVKQETLLQRAIALKQAGNWQEVTDTVKSLEGTPMYQSLLVQGLLQQAMTQLYKPDAAMLQIAMEDLPAVQPPVAPPETISVMPSM